MIPVIILDASVLIKWFVDEKDSDKALQILDNLRDHSDRYLFSNYGLMEVMSVLSRLSKKAAPVQEAIGMLLDLGINQLDVGREIWMATPVFAEKYRLSGFDAHYLALAQSAEGVWLTCDEEAAKRAKTSGLVWTLSQGVEAISEAG